MKQLKGHHVLCLKPFLQRNGFNVKYSMSDPETLVMILSVLVWKKNNGGKFKLYADTPAVEYLRSVGLLALYDEVDTKVLDNMPALNNDAFWAAGKIYAYKDAVKKEKDPCFIDMDAILWTPVKELKDGNAALIAAHWENFDCPEYNRAELNVPKGFRYPKWSSIYSTPHKIKMLNAAFLQFKDKELANLYFEEAIRFMVGNKVDKAHTVPHWLHICYAEQIVLADAALHLKKKVFVLGDYSDKFNPIHKHFTHIWGAKNLIVADKMLYDIIVSAKLAQIKREFNAWYKIAENALTINRQIKEIVNNGSTKP